MKPRIEGIGCVDPNATYAALDAALREGDRVTALSLLNALTEWVAKGGFLPTPVRDRVEPALKFPEHLEGRSWHWLINKVPSARDRVSALEVWCFSENRWHRTVGHTSAKLPPKPLPPPKGWVYHSKVYVP